MQPITLTEDSQSWNDNLAIDVDSRLVRNVAIAGTTSRNGYTYTETALREAVLLYSDKPVFLDHAENRQRPRERSTRDLVGSIVSPRFVEGRIRGDIRVLDTESGQMFLSLVSSETPGVGMSHVVLAQRSADGLQVERIAEVVSVDVVVNPATTSTFRESCPPLSEASHCDQGSLHSHAHLLAERDSLRSEVLRLESLLQQDRRRRAVDQQLLTSGLPPEAITECFREQLLSAVNEQARLTLIADRISLLNPGRRVGGIVRSTERQPPVPPSGDEVFIRAIRSR
ncbi:hypothetical protein [Planctomicrobium sp. SH664]|uniref:hypothetical protein n=1 Tax=Planctomicrobium sp. SH664 TaxID=3448125 RepID=UPI003F5B52A8